MKRISTLALLLFVSSAYAEKATTVLNCDQGNDVFRVQAAEKSVLLDDCLKGKNLDTVVYESSALLVLGRDVYTNVGVECDPINDTLTVKASSNKYQNSNFEEVTATGRVSDLTAFPFRQMGASAPAVATFYLTQKRVYSDGRHSSSRTKLNCTL